MKIPKFLSHLRTDRRGIPVPYVNRWGAEDAATVEVQWDRHVRGLAVFCLDVDETDPDFTAQNMQRQRECTIVGLCQVCARPIPWSRRFLVVSSMSVEPIQVLGKPVVVVTEPWLDQRCAEFALDRCPALIRRKRSEELRLVPVTSRRDTDIVVSRGWVEGPLEAETKARPVAMWAKIHLRAAAMVALAGAS